VTSFPCAKIPVLCRPYIHFVIPNQDVTIVDQVLQVVMGDDGVWNGLKVNHLVLNPFHRSLEVEVLEIKDDKVPSDLCGVSEATNLAYIAFCPLVNWM
jgi:hypothetical protein